MIQLQYNTAKNGIWTALIGTQTSGAEAIYPPMNTCPRVGCDHACLGEAS
jgi:hypothetical protein